MGFRYFAKDEFACNCCDKNRTAEQFIRQLDLARGIAGVPFHVNSGSRCQKHNKDEGGADNSRHLIVDNKETDAADICCKDSWTRGKILKALIEVGFKGIGIHEEFIHVDGRSGDLVIFLY